MAAVIVKGGSVLSVGHNRLCDHTAAYFGNSFHAEHDAIRKSPCDLRGAKMYVYRFARCDNTLRASKPCVFCQQELARAGISHVFFVDDREELVKESYRDSTGESYQYRHQLVGHTMCYAGGRLFN